MSPSSRHYTFQDILQAAQSQQRFDYTFWFSVLSQIILHESIRYLGYLLVILATGIITALGYCGFVYILPFYSSPLSVTYFINSLIGMFLLFNIYYNYFYAVITPPGSPDLEVYSITNQETLHTHERLKQCKKCNVIKPPRAHHCSTCEKCTLRMDHHCPWVNNCVGLRNYRFFVLFLLWTTVGTLYLTLLSTPPVITIIKTEIIKTTEIPSFSSTFPFFSLNSHRNTTNSGILDSLNGSHDSRENSFQLRGSLLNRPFNSHNLARKLIERESEVSPHDAGTQQVRDKSSSKVMDLTSVFLILMRPRLFSDIIDELDYDTLPIVITFMTAFAVHMAVLMLFLFHAYLGLTLSHYMTSSFLFLSLFFLVFLVLTGQTTIEFYINMNKRPPASTAASTNNLPLHPYDRGYVNNIQEIFGPYPWYIAILPFTRPSIPSDMWDHQPITRRRADTGYGSVLDV